MKGIVIISHGELANGLLDSAQLFFGENIPQVKACCFMAHEDPSAFGARVGEAIDEVDSGDGVLVLADIFGGTPCNQSLMLMKENAHILAGVNFSMLLDILTKREMDDYDPASSLAAAKEGIVDATAMMNGD